MNTVEVRLSSVHGRGVFTLKNIKAGEFVCTYDGELLPENIARNNDLFEAEYCISHPKIPNFVVCGYKYPKSKMGVGQLINDAKAIQLRKLDYKDGLDSIRVYEEKSQELANVDLITDERLDFTLSETSKWVKSSFSIMDTTSGLHSS